MPFCSECGVSKRTLNKDKVCRECVSKNGTEEGAGVSSGSMQSEEFGDPNHFWENMNKLFDKKFNEFEETFKDSLMKEVKQITDPISKDVKELKNENKTLKTELTTLKAKSKEQEEKLEKVEKALREHQKTLVRTDKDARAKRLILAGVSEDETTINGVEFDNDDDKVAEVMKVLEVEDVSIANSRRIGKKDQGGENRPRYLLIEFHTASDRNKVRKKSEKLKENDDTKLLYLKADSTKKEREEYKRLYDLKKRIEEEDATKEVRIEYGKLYVGEQVVDEVSTENKDFL